MNSYVTVRLLRSVRVGVAKSRLTGKEQLVLRRCLSDLNPKGRLMAIQIIEQFRAKER